MQLAKPFATTAAVIAAAILAAVTSGRTTQSASPSLPLVPSANAQAAVTSLSAYPELKTYTVRKINAIYTSIPKSVPRPGFSRQFACTIGGTYTYDWGVREEPPNCTNTGTFYRKYTIPIRAAAEAIVVLPSDDASSISLPSGDGPKATGFLYIEGWPGAGTTNSEGGLAYAAGSRTYVPYLASPGKSESVANNWNIQPGSTVFLRVGSDEDPRDMTTLPPRQKSVSCRSGCIYLIVAVLNGSCPSRSVCIDRERELSSGWEGNCCIFGLMTTIARNQEFTFDGGFTFGPIGWRRPYTETEYAPATGSSAQKYRYDGCAPAPLHPTGPAPLPTASPAGFPCQSGGFSSRGSQSYPDSTSYVRPTPVPGDDQNVTIVNP